MYVLKNKSFSELLELNELKSSYSGLKFTLEMLYTLCRSSGLRMYIIGDVYDAGDSGD